MSTPRPAILILGLALALAACSPTPSVVPSTGPSGSQAGPRPVTLLLGFQPDVQFAPFYLAQQEGLFADAGLDVTIEHSDDVIRLVADGQSEFGVADATDVMIARTSGIPIKYVSTLYGHFPVALIGAPETLPAEPSGLAGLRIGTPGTLRLVVACAAGAARRRRPDRGRRDHPRIPAVQPGGRAAERRRGPDHRASAPTSRCGSRRRASTSR